MKKITFIIQITFLCVGLSCFSQESKSTNVKIKDSKFSILASSGIGFGTIKNSQEPNYNLSSNYSEVLINYSLSDKLGLATGLGF